MSKFQITSSAAADMGVYEGATADDAVEACCRDAGYASKAEAEEVMGEEFAAIVTLIAE